MGTAFFPLDEELELLPGSLTPKLHEQLVRLGAWMPFDKAGGTLVDFMNLTSVSAATARRQTESAGVAYVAEQTAAVEHLEQVCPPAPAGSAKVLLSVDGAMVPLVGGEWGEAKTLAIGEVGPPQWVAGEEIVHTHSLSYFSRLTDNHTFTRLALVETHRRGVETAGAAGAVSDGAEWIPGFIDYHRSDAERILDLMHAGSYVSRIGTATLGTGQICPQPWFSETMHRLKYAGPTDVLADLCALQLAHPNTANVAEALAYLEKRVDQMQYPKFRAAGWPIGSGVVESANKLVVEARLKGSGMHWARAHVDPMLALRTAVCSDRWAEVWPQIAHRRRQTTRKLRPAAPEIAPCACAAPTCEPPPADPPPPPDPTPVPKPTGLPHRPADDHPWRRMPLGKARYEKNTPSLN